MTLKVYVLHGTSSELNKIVIIVPKKFLSHFLLVSLWKINKIGKMKIEKKKIENYFPFSLLMKKSSDRVRPQLDYNT